MSSLGKESITVGLTTGSLRPRCCVGIGEACVTDPTAAANAAAAAAAAAAALTMFQLNDTLQCRAKAKGQAAVNEALACIGVLAGALHLSWQPYAQQLLSVMMLTGPSKVGWGVGVGRGAVWKRGWGRRRRLVSEVFPRSAS
jgi:hypothetical protein